MNKPHARFWIIGLAVGVLLSSGCSLLTPSSSSVTLSSSVSSSSSVVSSLEEVPEIIYEGESRLIYNEEESRRELSLLSGESRKLHFRLSDNDGAYVLSFACASEYIELDGDTILAKDIGEYSSVRSTLTLRVSQKDGKVMKKEDLTLVIYKGENAAKVRLAGNEDLALDRSTYRLSLRKKGTAKVVPSCPSFPEARFEYGEIHGDAIVLNNDEITPSEKAEVGDKAYFYVYALVDGQRVGSVMLSVTIVQNHPEISYSFLGGDERLTVEKLENSYLGEYRFTGAYGGIDYALPKLTLSGYEAPYALSYQGDADFFTFSRMKEQDYLRANPALTSGNIFFTVTASSEEGEELVSVPCCFHLTGLGEGEFHAYLGEEKALLKDGDTIELQQYLDFPLSLTYNGKEVSLSKYLLIEDQTILSLNKTALSAKKEGTTTLRFAYQSVDAEGMTYDYSIRINVQVKDRSKLNSLKVEGGASAITLIDGHLYIDGRILVSYDIGREVAVNGADGLSFTILDTAEEGVKEVTFTYAERGMNVSATYKVTALSSGSMVKKTLTKDYASFNSASCVTPKEGDIRCLVIPVWFTDSSSYINDARVDANGIGQKEQIRADLNQVVFGDGYSVASFYEEESRLAFSLSGKVTPWYEAGVSASSLKVKNYGDMDEFKIAANAVNWYFSASGESLSDYDGNQDGVIDSLMMYYGSNGYGAENYSRAFQIRGSIRNAPNSFAAITWFSALDMYGINGKTDPAKQLETDDLSSLTPSLDPSTAIHEFGHTFGLADYYDEYGVDADNRRYSPAGGFSMQDSNLGGHDPFSTLAIGWNDPYVYDATLFESGDALTVTLHDFQSSGETILLTPKWDADKEVFDEYMLLELYSPTGLNERAAKKYSYYDADHVGIRLWHVHGDKEEEIGHVYDNFTNPGEENGFDLLHLLRRDPAAPYKNSSHKLSESLFLAGDTFDMASYKTQFALGNGKLDSGKSLGWSFTIDSLGTEASGNSIARITLTRA